jgi:hypothetical protein
MNCFIFITLVPHCGLQVFFHHCYGNKIIVLLLYISYRMLDRKHDYDTILL